MDNNQVSELTDSEIDEVAGGPIPLLGWAAIAVGGLVVAGCAGVAAGYYANKD